MIQESTIERTLNRLESGREDFEVEFRDFAESQPDLAAFLTNEENTLLSEQEREILLFGALVIYESVNDQLVTPAPCTQAMIGQAEEANYELMPEKGAFRDRLTPLFEDSEEEELLAFAEDLIVADADEETTIAKDARAPMFVMLKTVVDVLTA